MTPGSVESPNFKNRSRGRPISFPSFFQKSSGAPLLSSPGPGNVRTARHSWLRRASVQRRNSPTIISWDNDIEAVELRPGYGATTPSRRFGTRTITRTLHHRECPKPQAGCPQEPPNRALSQQQQTDWVRLHIRIGQRRPRPTEGK